MRDIRFAFRVAKQNPGSTAAALVAMTLGLGASTAMFSVINGVLLRPLPAKDPGRVVELYQSSGKINHGRLSMRDFLDWRSRVHSLESMAIYRMNPANLSGDGPPTIEIVLDCDPALLQVLGLAPARGRAFEPGENRPGRQFEALLSWNFWKDRFGGEQGIVGKKILLDRVGYQIIGVLPEGFQMPGEMPASLWRPLPEDFHGPLNARRVRVYHGIGRLASGATLGKANGELASVQADLARQHPADDRGTSALCVLWRKAIVGDVGTMLLLLCGAVGCVLLIACGNTANLLLVRAVARQSEISIRIAVGANRGQIVRQLLTESLLLSSTAACLAIGMAWETVRVIRNLPDTRIPNSGQIVLDWRIVLFATAMALLTGVLFGLAPAWRISAARVHDALKQTSGRSTETRAEKSFRAGLVASEAALAVLLAVGSGLLIHSFLKVAAVNPGFNPKNLLTLPVSLTSGRYGTPGAETQFISGVLTKVRALPGVRSAAFGSSVPLGLTSGRYPVRIEGDANDDVLRLPQVLFGYITPRYFQTMGIPLIAGRDLEERDNAHSPPVAIVNRTFAKALLHGGSGVGKRTRYFLEDEWREIVGVVGDVPQESFERGVEPQIYLPNAQVEDGWTNLLVRVDGDPKLMERAVKAQLAEVDPTVSAYSGLHTMDDVTRRALGWRTFSTSALGIFAVIAILLASVGIYAVIAYSVAQRTSEIGLRMALGAQSSQILRMVLWQGVGPAALGAVAGACAAMGISRWLQDLLFQVTTLDGWAYAISVALVIGVAAVACAGPALRAASIDPNRALRDE
jgi:putative ABC transport system permease protein